MTKKVLLISILIILYFKNIESMNGIPSASFVSENFNLTQSLNNWKKLHPLTNKEMRIYNKTWNYKETLYRNKTNLADLFYDVCCDLSFRVVKMENNIVYGKSATNPNIIFLDDLAVTHSFLRKNLEKYAVTNFLNSVGDPREFTFEIREQIKKQIRTLTEDSVGCKLLRITTAKIVTGKLPKLIFIPVQKDSESVIDDGMSINFGKYGWQIESDKFMSRVQLALTAQQKIFEVKNRSLDFQKYSKMKLPNYRYVLFSPENFFNRPVVDAIRNVGQKFEFFHVQLPPDATFFRIIVRSLFPHKSNSRAIIKARLNLGKKKFSQKLSQKFNDILTLMTEADCITEKTNPQIFQQIRKLGGIKNYAKLFVKTMSQTAKLERIENLVASYYGNDEDFRIQHGLTAGGFDALSESSYLSHRYHWIRTSNLIRQKNFASMYKTFIQELGDFDLYSYYLSQNSEIKFPKFGVNQYKCADDPNLTSEGNADQPQRTKKTHRVRFLQQESNRKSPNFCKI
ncbi:MAG: hypothetical protein J6S86_04730 [Alphaproteobacteria bacterium]|nr:hypothetical protein [Alphaproteobacteria bacterium]